MQTVQKAFVKKDLTTHTHTCTHHLENLQAGFDSVMLS